MKKPAFVLTAFLFGLWQSLLAVCPAVAVTPTSSPATGDAIVKYVIVGAAICAVLLVIVVLMGKKRK